MTRRQQSRWRRAINRAVRVYRRNGNCGGYNYERQQHVVPGDEMRRVRALLHATVRSANTREFAFLWAERWLWR